MKCRQRGCRRPQYCRGYCGTHWWSRLQKGLPMPSTYTPFSARYAEDIDETVVERLMKGDRTVAFTSWERREAVRRMAAAGLPKREIARRINRNDRQVYRDLAAFNAASCGFPVEQEAAG